MSENTATNAGARLAGLPPLGWAAKRLEDGLSEFVDTLFAGEFGLVRRHWQLLRWVAERDEPRAEAFVAEAAIFYTALEARQVHHGCCASPTSSTADGSTICAPRRATRSWC